ncbi:MAG: hypothetical protein AVO33_11055 [delta proteobacterium ML8_F1]|nr:MAG: hypothetical protein AVO33_11055 [delta proteobacterium ML8_F1]
MNHPAFLIQDNDDLEKARLALVESSAIFIDYLFQFINEKNFIVVLTDHEGNKLQSVGGEYFKKRFDASVRINTVSRQEESSAGDTAIAKCLKQKKPVQLCGKDHENPAHHSLSCYAAPVLYHGEILGSLCITEFTEVPNKTALGLVIASAKGIENQVYNHRNTSKIVEQSRYQNAIVENIEEGFLTIDNRGVVTYINHKATQMLALDPHHTVGRFIGDLVPFEPIVLEVLDTGEGYVDREYVLTNNAGQKMHLLKTAMPIRDDEGNLTGVIDIFREIEYIKNIVNKMVGARANFTFEDIVGETPVLKDAIDRARSAARSNSNILIQGESGTGKELFAHSIHNHSDRRNKPFVAINCAAIPRELIESELFGYAKGSFTGGLKGGRPGKFELAKGGTIFLDEIGELPMDVQAKLLRVLQDKRVIRVGGDNIFDVDVRIIAATNKDLYVEAQKNNFRWDMYYRLNVLKVNIPPLRERRKDIPLIADYLVRKINRRLDTRVKGVSPSVLEKFERYPWEGNVRELENVIEQMMNRCDSEWLDTDLLPEDYRETATEEPPVGEYKIQSYEEAEKDLLQKALTYYQGNITKTAQNLKVSRNTLYNKISKYQLML